MEEKIVMMAILSYQLKIRKLFFDGPLGSSEILESLFGKFKYIEGDQASSGLSSLVLSIPALVGKLDEFVVRKALETVSCADINEWIEQNMGQTFLSQRRKALDKCCKNEYIEYLELCNL
jgi:hypothetical protein